MPSYYRSKKKNARAMIEKRIALIAAVAVLLVVMIVLLSRCSRGKDVTTANAPVPTPEPSAVAAISALTPEPTLAPTPTPAPTQRADIPFAYTASTDPDRAARAITRPVADEGWLPIFKQAETDEKIVAITVDDCFQINNLKEIIQLAIDNGGKLTIFPIGQQALRESHAPVLKAAWEAGMELENHTFTHNGLYYATDEELANEIYVQNYALDYILGGEYECHFLRPRGGDARADQRIHAYCKQMDYAGIAHWTYSGREEGIMQKITPGAIYLFHCTDEDLRILREFIPEVARQGYKMVTMNEMFGYEDNAFTPKEIAYGMPEVPPLEPYEEVPVEFKKGRHAYGVFKIQARLKELGYLQDDPDGIFGDNTVMAIAYFQQAASLEITGVATIETQEKLFASDAPRYGG